MIPWLWWSGIAAASYGSFTDRELVQIGGGALAGYGLRAHGIRAVASSTAAAARIPASIGFGAARGAIAGAARSYGGRLVGTAAARAGVGIAGGAAAGIAAAGPIGAAYGALSPTMTAREGFMLGLEGAVTFVTDPAGWDDTVSSGLDSLAVWRPSS